MGMVLVLGVIVALVGVIALYVHALRADPSPEAHRWIVLVPMLIFVAWLLEQLVMS